jgi:hypothetical protein
VRRIDVGDAPCSRLEQNRFRQPLTSSGGHSCLTQIIAVRRSVDSNPTLLGFYALLRPWRKLGAGALAERQELGSNILHLETLN